MPSNKYRTKERLAFFLKTLPIFLLILVTVIAASQLDQVREFFSRATGEPANIYVNTQQALGPMPRPWQHLAQGGEDHAWRMESLVPQVQTVSPQYIRLDHIYDFYDVVQGSSGNLSFNFSKLDLVLNDIQAAGATPYISLSYMPPAIAQGDIVSQPVNYADWQITVQRTIEHISGTRGFEDVYYEVWNEPDLFGGWKYYGDKNYLHLYSAAAQGAANARGVRAFKIGGPATTALYKNWFDALLTHATENNLRLDFFSWHRYSHSINQYREDISQVRTWLQQYPEYEQLIELHLTEWGPDSENHTSYDNNAGAAHLAAGAIEMVGVLDKAFIFEIQDGKDPQGATHWGRWGLFTHESAGSTAKPRFRALQLLNSIGRQRLPLLGKGTWVKGLAARNDLGGFEVVLANYDQYGRHSENVPVTFDNIEPGTYQISKNLFTGQNSEETVATSEAKLRTEIFMPPNTVGKVGIKKID